MTKRQVADAIVCAVLDAERETRDEEAGVRTVHLGDAVIETLEESGVGLVNLADITHPVTPIQPGRCPWCNLPPTTPS